MDNFQLSIWLEEFTCGCDACGACPSQYEDNDAHSYCATPTLDAVEEDLEKWKSCFRINDRIDVS
jgi:hypothetical protein